MTAIDIATGRLVEHLQSAAAPETSAAEHEARLIAQVRNATIAECQRELRSLAGTMERAFPDAGLPMILVSAYRGAADHLEALRT